MHGSSLYVCVSVYRCICMDQVYMYVRVFIGYFYYYLFIYLLVFCMAYYCHLGGRFNSYSLGIKNK